ncbi:unnamed protein product [Ectocarpus sp. 6 AP-2014]
MGITGLLPFLKSVTYPTHISEYRGLKAGVDAYCWLHRGAFSCGMELCTGVATDKYVAFCMKRVNLLLHHGIQPVMVFDGASLPIKRSINLERRRQRESARSKGEAALAAGEAGAAAQHFSKAVGVTHDMAFLLMKALRQAGVELIVAPYEADAQLAFLSRTGAVDVVLSEDSDCLPYGCKKVLFKMDNEGHGQEIQLRNLAANTPLSLSNWKNSMFLDLCLLVGCDYIPSSVKGLGIATAYKLVDRHRSLDKIIGAINSSRFVIPEGYWEQYKRARLTFRHHIIYNPETETTMHLMPIGNTAKELDNLRFLGEHLQPPIAQGVGSGRLLPTSHQPYETAAPLERGVPCSPPPSPEAQKKPPVDATAALSPAAAAASADGAGVAGGTCWDQRVEEDGEHQVGPMSSVQSPLSRAFIDSPFCASRSALREPPFVTHGDVTAPQALVGWGVASSDTASGWATGVNRHQPSVSEACVRDDDRRAAGSDPTHLGGREERRQSQGLDLVRIRGGELSAEPALGFSPTVRSAVRESSGTSRGDKPSCRARGEDTLWPFAPHSQDEKGHMDDGKAMGWQQGPGAGLRATGEGWGHRLSVESGETADARHDGHKNEGCMYPAAEESAHRKPDSREANQDHACEANVRQGLLALTCELPVADQAKFVPASAQHFRSTQVSQGLETLQRRKRRLYPAEDPECLGLPSRGQQHQVQPGAADMLHGSNLPVFGARVDSPTCASGVDRPADNSGLWMVQPQEARGISSVNPPAPVSSPVRLRAEICVGAPEARVLTASSRRWTLPVPSTAPPVNREGFPLLRLLDGKGKVAPDRSWSVDRRIGGAMVGQPSPKRTRGVEFWDNLLG